ncbi:hypothetical protein [Ruminococcus sp. zg-924]|uniref:hypothetical protein n=1 Tax=Ruminococcus sp. zg-924 TaxID=2678505 RepID=UPI00210D59AD|nr:hypothetical protein [Ruminococcus sp. zg-924]MCQ4022488.1 hypothetical protein [Ruminococcus sp. zg-924]
MSEKNELPELTAKTAHDIAFTVHKRHYYDCREVDDVLDRLLELIDKQEQEKLEIDSRLREYEANIASILLDLQKLKTILQQEDEITLLEAEEESAEEPIDESTQITSETQSDEVADEVQDEQKD